MKIIAGCGPSDPDPWESGYSLPATVATELLTRATGSLQSVLCLACSHVSGFKCTYRLPIATKSPEM